MQVTLLKKDDSFSLSCYAIAPKGFYTGQQAVCILGAASVGRKTNVSMMDIDTEAPHDLVNLLFIDPTAAVFQTSEV